MELRGVVLLLFPPPSIDSSSLLVGGNGLLVAWLALLRSIGPRPTPTPIWPEGVLNCLSEREAGLGVGGTPWVKE